MNVRVLDLDDSLLQQPRLCAMCRPTVVPLAETAPDIRLACGFSRFARFESELADRLGSSTDAAPAVTFYGSGDFHHVSLALVRRLREPINLLVIDNHPDWMRGVPFLHCGTWLWHAAWLPCVRRVFHVGGDVDFENAYRWLAPWPLLRRGKITVLPAVRRFRTGAWAEVSNVPLRPRRAEPLTPGRMEKLLGPFRGELARRPLYVSLDKDVLVAADAAVNWDSGHLRLEEVETVLEAFWHAAEGKLAGMDIVGDWSPVRARGWFRQMFHHTMHPPLTLEPETAARRNEETNLRLLRCAPLRSALEEAELFAASRRPRAA